MKQAMRTQPDPVGASRAQGTDLGPGLEAGSSRGLAPVLGGAREIVDFIASLAVEPVDRENLEDLFRGARATLRLVPIGELVPGHPDLNRRSKAKEARYLRLDLGTMPPLLVEAQEGGLEIEDGHHRHRVCLAKGVGKVWCYVVEFEGEAS
jgi:hypothetical protein